MLLRSARLATAPTCSSKRLAVAWARLQRQCRWWKGCSAAGMSAAGASAVAVSCSGVQDNSRPATTAELIDVLWGNKYVTLIPARTQTEAQPCVASVTHHECGAALLQSD